jgi:hypothetical protein
MKENKESDFVKINSEKINKYGLKFSYNKILDNKDLIAFLPTKLRLIENQTCGIEPPFYNEDIQSKDMKLKNLYYCKSLK